LAVPFSVTLTDPLVVPTGRFAGSTVTVNVAGGELDGCVTVIHPNGPEPKFTLAVRIAFDGPVIVTPTCCEIGPVKFNVIEGGEAIRTPLPLAVNVNVTGTITVLLVPFWRNVIVPVIPDGRLVEGSETFTV
jgi:hypothetical protein